EKPQAKRGRRATRGTERDPSSASRTERAAPRRSKAILPLAIVGALAVLGGGGAFGYKVYVDRKELAEKERKFLDDSQLGAPNRDPRKALALGKSLPEDVRQKPAVKASLAQLEVDVKALDDRQAATDALAAVTETSSPDDRLKAANDALSHDKNYGPAYL